MPDLATYTDVEAAWRTLTAEEQARATALIGRASRQIRARWTDVDARILAGTLDPEAVVDVVVEMVQSAMIGPPGAQQFSESAGPFSASVTYANPLGRLFFTADMIAVFEGQPQRVRQAWLA